MNNPDFVPTCRASSISDRMPQDMLLVHSCRDNSARHKLVLASSARRSQATGVRQERAMLSHCIQNPHLVRENSSSMRGCRGSLGKRLRTVGVLTICTNVMRYGRLGRATDTCPTICDTHKRHCVQTPIRVGVQSPTLFPEFPKST